MSHIHLRYLPIDVSIILNANPAPWFANSPVPLCPKNPSAAFKPV